MKGKTVVISFTGLIVIIWLLTACGAPAATASNPTEFKVTATDFKFEPADLTLKAGQKIKLTMTNKGAIDHTWLLKDASGKELSQTLTVKNGETKSLEFAAPATPGTYTLLCDVPGHKELGMVGKVIVQ
ncbi:MAG: cupredoxin domain-containing protein [Chloroflexi bacterium]|nr:cupredoxin domain-containing protein [Chloroflexota bacterium]